MDFYLRLRDKDADFQEMFYKNLEKKRKSFSKIQLNRKAREKSKNTKSITNAFNQKWLKEHNKEEK